MDIMADTKPETVTLADGKEYELPPINLNTLANLEQSIGFGLGQLPTRISDETAITMRLLIWGLLKERYPKMKIEEVGELVTFDILKKVSEILTKVLAVST